MSHINSHREPRRSKIRDHRRAPSRWHATHHLPPLGNSVQKKAYVRARRQAERQAWAHLKDFRCAGGLECDCVGCEATVLVSQRQRKIRIPLTDWCEFLASASRVPPSRCLNDWEIIQVKEALGRPDLPDLRGADLRGSSLSVLETIAPSETVLDPIPEEDDNPRGAHRARYEEMETGIKTGNRVWTFCGKLVYVRKSLDSTICRACKEATPADWRYDPDFWSRVD